MDTTGWRSERARLAALTRHHPEPDSAEEAERERLRANLRLARASRVVQELVAEAPPLTAEQRAHLAALLAAPGEPEEAVSSGGEVA